MAHIARHTAFCSSVPSMTNGSSKRVSGSSRYRSIRRAARSARALAGGFSGVDGCRYLMPVTSSPLVATPTFIFGNSTIASYISALYRVAGWFSSRLLRQLLDLREELVRNLNALAARAFLRGEAARAGQTHFRVGEHRAYHGLHSLQILGTPGKRAGVDGDEGLADARLVAFLREERIGLGSDRRAGERGADQLEHEREHGAFRAADRKEAAVLDGFLRIVRRLAMAVERPAIGNLLAFAHRHHDAAAHDRRERKVDHQRIVLLARENRRDGVRAEERLLPAPRRNRRRRVGESEADEPGLRHRQEVDAEHADVRAVRDAAEGDAIAARALDHLFDRPLHRHV